MVVESDAKCGERTTRTTGRTNRRSSNVTLHVWLSPHARGRVSFWISFCSFSRRKTIYLLSRQYCRLERRTSQSLTNTMRGTSEPDLLHPLLTKRGRCSCTSSLPVGGSLAFRGIRVQYFGANIVVSDPASRGKFTRGKTRSRYVYPSGQGDWRRRRRPG